MRVILELGGSLAAVYALTGSVVAVERLLWLVVVGVPVLTLGGLVAVKVLKVVNSRRRLAKGGQ